MLPQIGKLDKQTFDTIIYPQLGKKDRSVLIGPQHGVDAAVIELPGPGNNVLVVKIDPTFGMPTLMPVFGWSIVHICASDVACMGVRPRYMQICLMLPPGTADSVLEETWKQIHQECEKLGIAIVGGHTGIYPGIAYPLNGGCAMMGIGTKDQLTPACNARAGDKLIITKGPAIEAVGILAYEKVPELEKKLGKATVKKAQGYLTEMTVVKDAITAAPYAHAMHDATEGGLLNGVAEVAIASKIGVTVYEDKIVTPDEISAVCKFFNIDPLISISEGTLVIASAPDKAPKMMSELKKAGITAFEIGEFTDKGMSFVRKNGKKEVLTPVKVDPFWAAYFSALGGG